MNKLSVNFQQIQNELDFENGGISFDLNNLTLGNIITHLLDYIFAGAGIILILYLMAGGLQYMTSGGDPKKTQAAKQSITNAIIGIVILFASYWVVQAIGLILGVEVFSTLFS